MVKQHAFLSAGGTGGHLFPAQALAHALIARGWTVDLVTDERASRYAGHFPARHIFEVPSATLGSKNPIALFKTFRKLWSGYRQARALLREHKPSIVVGFGGYPTLPPLLAASNSGVASMVHEQNSVMGRANALLAARVKHIALGFPPTSGVMAHEDKTTITGNPIRPAVLEASSQLYVSSQADDIFKLVVFGGSQGAQYFSQVMPAALALMPEKARNRFDIVQQARPEDVDALTAAYLALGIKHEIAPFFDHMAQRIADAHLVMSRSGASTVSELSVIGRPAILVPYPHALDHDQAANAAALAGAGGAEIMMQSALTPEVLAQKFQHMMDDAEGLASMAASAKAVGKPHAAEALADLVERIAEEGTI